MNTRVSVKPERGCEAVYLPCSEEFYALFLLLIRKEYVFFNTITPLCL